MRRDRRTRKQGYDGDGGWLYCDASCPWLDNSDGSCVLLGIELSCIQFPEKRYCCPDDCSFPDEETVEYLEGE